MGIFRATIKGARKEKGKMETNYFDYLKELLEWLICDYEELIYCDISKATKKELKRRIAIRKDKLKRLYNISLTNKDLKKLVDNDTEQELLIGYNFFGHYTRWF